MVARTAGRLAAAALVAGGCAAAAWGLACGLPKNGLLEDFWDSGASDGTTGATGDGAGDEAPPSSCPTVDAACLGGIPSGWQPVVVTDGGCGAAFTKVTMLSNPRVEDGGCACGACRVIGAYTCEGPVVITSGDGCNDTPPLVPAAMPGVCTDAQAQHVEAHPVDASGTVACSAANDAGTGGTGDPLTVCYPGCAADYCAAGARCIIGEGDLVCPAGFVRLATAGSAVDPGCAPCACTATPTGPCGGTVTVFDDSKCGDSGASATYPVGDCEQFTTTGDFNSLVVNLVPPDAACALPPGPLGSDASLVNASTICCK